MTCSKLISGYLLLHRIMWHVHDSDVAYEMLSKLVIDEFVSRMTGEELILAQEISSATNLESTRTLSV